MQVRPSHTIFSGGSTGSSETENAAGPGESSNQAVHAAEGDAGPGGTHLEGNSPSRPASDLGSIGSQPGDRLLYNRGDILLSDALGRSTEPDVDQRLTHAFREWVDSLGQPEGSFRADDRFLTALHDHGEAHNPDRINRPMTDSWQRVMRGLRGERAGGSGSSQGTGRSGSRSLRGERTSGESDPFEDLLEAMEGNRVPDWLANVAPRGQGPDVLQQLLEWADHLQGQGENLPLAERLDQAIDQLIRAYTASVERGENASEEAREAVTLLSELRDQIAGKTVSTPVGPDLKLDSQAGPSGTGHDSGEIRPASPEALVGSQHEIRSASDAGNSGPERLPTLGELLNWQGHTEADRSRGGEVGPGETGHEPEPGISERPADPDPSRHPGLVGRLRRALNFRA